MFYGVAYYPEHWPEENWAKDAKNIRDCGMDGVRIGEFAWCRMEPEEAARKALEESGFMDFSFQ